MKYVFIVMLSMFLTIVFVKYHIQSEIDNGNTKLAGTSKLYNSFGFYEIDWESKESLKKCNVVRVFRDNERLILVAFLLSDKMEEEKMVFITDRIDRKLERGTLSKHQVVQVGYCDDFDCKSEWQTFKSGAKQNQADIYQYGRYKVDTIYKLEESVPCPEEVLYNIK